MVVDSQIKNSNAAGFKTEVPTASRISYSCPNWNEKFSSFHLSNKLNLKVLKPTVSTSKVYIFRLKQFYLNFMTQSPD